MKKRKTTLERRSENKAPLTAAEERALLEAVRAGQALETTLNADPRGAVDTGCASVQAKAEAARSRLVELNQPLVKSIARDYLGRGMDQEDLVQEGILGLIHAIDRFDTTRGTRLSTYATWWIRQAIGRALQERGRLIRLPASAYEDLAKIAEATEQLQLDAEHAADRSTVAARAGLSDSRVVELLVGSQGLVSIDTPASANGEGEDDRTLADQISDREVGDLGAGLEREELLSELEAVLGELSDLEQQVIRARFGYDTDEPQTLEAIGRRLHMSREKTRQVELSAFRRLRSPEVQERLLARR